MEVLSHEVDFYVRHSIVKRLQFINDSQVWLLMLKKYNTSVYSYNEDEVDEMIMLIHDSFVPAFTDVKDILLKKLEEVESDWM